MERWEELSAEIAEWARAGRPYPEGVELQAKVDEAHAAGELPLGHGAGLSMRIGVRERFSGTLSRTEADGSVTTKPASTLYEGQPTE